MAERIHASGACAYDATLTARTRDSNVTVQEASIGLEYPIQGFANWGPREWRADLIATSLARA